MARTSLIIEHCEDKLSEWLMLEYEHATKLWVGKTIFTCVKDRKTIAKLKSIGTVDRRGVEELFPDGDCIVLDPAGKTVLKTADFDNLGGIVVGGILGYEKPHGRTKALISDRCGFSTRNLGKLQLSIDGAVFVAHAISMGMVLADIEIAKEIEIVHDSHHSTILPFGYPVIDNNPIITPGLIEYISRTTSGPDKRWIEKDNTPSESK